MVITGSALFIEFGSETAVREKLKDFPSVTFQVASESKTELVVTMEAEDFHELESLCSRLRNGIPELIDITHIYVNFEEEVDKALSGRSQISDE